MLLVSPQYAIAEPPPPTEVVPVVEEKKEEVYADFASLVKTPSPLALCNCWQYVKEAYYPDLPSMRTIIAGTSDPYGDIAVFYYPSSGLYHFAKVIDMGVGVFYIDETNYSRCTHSRREISFTDPNLVGFYSMQ